MCAAATDSQPIASPAGTERAAEGQEHLLRHVLGLVPGAEHPGGDRDDPRVGGAEDLLEVGPDRSAARWARHRHPLLRAHGDRPGLGRGDSPMSDDVHTRRAPPGPGM